MKKIINKYTVGKFQFFLAKVLRHLPISHSLKQKYNLFRHKKIEEFLLPYFKIAEKTISNDKCLDKNDGPIWLFWWQDENNMPLIVKKCINSVIKNSNGRKVVLITHNNIDKYYMIPKRIQYLKDTNQISMAHFSDVIRFNLLKKYGGLWIDATILVTKKIDSKYFSNFFTCSGYCDEDDFFVTNGNWCSFLIGGKANHPVFQFMSAFYKAYWDDNDGLIDYFIIDYALRYAWKHNWGNFKSFTNMNKNKYNPNLFDLVKELNTSFDQKKWEKLNNNTEMFKLTYKMRFRKNKNTFYNFIINMDR